MPFVLGLKMQLWHIIWLAHHLAGTTNGWHTIWLAQHLADTPFNWHTILDVKRKLSFHQVGYEKSESLLLHSQ